jgi:hypothetical protein
LSYSQISQGFNTELVTTVLGMIDDLSFLSISAFVTGDAENLRLTA